MDTNENYFNLVASIIQNSISPISIVYTKNEKFKKINNRIKFADSKLIKLFCDCSENFEFNKLSKIIIKHNKKLIKNL